MPVSKFSFGMERFPFVWKLYRSKVKIGGPNCLDAITVRQAIRYSISEYFAMQGIRKEVKWRVGTEQ